MKMKHLLCALLAVTVMSTSAISSAIASEPENEKASGASGQTHSEYVVSEDTAINLSLENPYSFNEDGSVKFSTDELLDLILPKDLNGETLTTIEEKSFDGCPYIRTVVIPETITTIGDNAFADCEFLETIYVIGHAEDDMTLGENWNGDAEVVFYAGETDEDNTSAAEKNENEVESTETVPSGNSVKEPENEESKPSTTQAAPVVESKEGKNEENQVLAEDQQKPASIENGESLEENNAGQTK